MHAGGQLGAGAARRARRRVLRPRQDADGGLLGRLLRPCGVRDGHDLALGASRATCTRTCASACAGSTDDRADDVRKRVGEMIAGVRVRDLQRLSPRVLAGVLPRLYPQMLAARLRAPGRGRARLHPHRRLAGDGRPARARARLRRRPRLALGDRRRPLHRPPRGPVQLPRGQGRSRCASWPSARGSTCGAPTPTRTPSRTCRCCARWVTPVVVNPDAELRRIAPTRAGRCCISTGSAGA